jgi:hypothetical protein
MRRCIHHVTAALLVAACFGAAACSGDGSEDAVELEDSAEPAESTTTTEPDETDGEPTKEEVAAVLGGDATGVSDDDAMCVGLALVDAVGLERLLDSDAFEQMDANPDASLADIGITLDEAQKAALIDGLHECGDLRAMLRDGMAADGTIPPEGAACVVDGLDDAFIDRLFLTGITGGEAALDADPELMDAFVSATVACVQAGVNMGE